MIGIVRQVSSIVGVLAGFFAGIRYYPLLTGILQRWIENPGFRDIAAFMVIFCGVFIGVVLLAWVIILSALPTFLPSNTSVVQQSRLARYLMPVSEKITLVVTSEVKSRYDKNIDDYIKAWKK